MTRRSLLLTPLTPLATAAAAAPAKPRVAVVMNVYFPNSHADVFVGRLLEGYRLNGVSHRPRLDTRSFYVDTIYTIRDIVEITEQTNNTRQHKEVCVMI